MSLTAEEIREQSDRHLGGVTDGAAMMEAVLTWEGYLVAVTEWGSVGISEHHHLLKGLFARVDETVPDINIARPPPTIEEERNRLRQERGPVRSDPHPEYRTDYWSHAAPIRGFLRASASGAKRREVALVWSGYVAALEEHRLVPPGHAARLMAELEADLRPGDPWERIAAEAGLDVAALTPAGQARARDLTAQGACERRRKGTLLSP